jgi:hypothetical protein
MTSRDEAPSDGVVRARVSPALAGRRIAACVCAFALAATGASAQAPLTLADGRLRLGGQASLSFGSADEGYFNYSSYAYSLLRLLRLDGTADLRVNDHVSALGDLRALISLDNGDWLVRPYALFARIRPWVDRPVDIQAGIIPPVFGVFSRHAYETDNPLIGYPLGYQYLTPLRSNALPASVSDLLRMRGRGWLTRYPIGEPTAQAGLPVVDGLRYQSGVELHAGRLQPLEAAVAWTSGALSTPSWESGNGGRQVSGRLAVRPASGLILGVSGSRGVFLSSALRETAAVQDAGDQKALGLDAEYSRGHYVVRSEAIYSHWRLPLAEPPSRLSLGSLAVDIEGRYRISPRMYAAARLDHLWFSDVAGPDGQTPWEFPVTRVQVGAGYTVSRHALMKFEWQYDRRDSVGTAAPGAYGAQPSITSYGTAHLFSAQLVAWF